MLESTCTGEVVELNDEGVVDTQLTTLSELFTFPCAVVTLVWYDDGEVGIDVTTDVFSTDCASMKITVKKSNIILNISFKNTVIIIANTKNWEK